MVDLSASEQAFINKMKKSDEHIRSGIQLLLEKRENFPDYFDALKEAGIFDKSGNQGPIPSKEKRGGFTIPFWESLVYLKAVAKWSGDNNSVPVANKVLDVVREISNERVEGKPKDNYHTWRTFAEILSLVPTEAILLSDIDLIATWVDSDFHHGSIGHVIGDQLLPKLLSSPQSADWDKACCVLDYMLQVRWEEKGSSGKREPSSIIEGYWLKELLKNNLRAFAEKSGDKTYQIFLEKLREVYSEIEPRIPSWSSRPAIEDHDQNYSWKDIENCLVEGPREILSIRLQNDFDRAKSAISDLLEGNLEIERRIGIYLVNAHFSKLKSLLPKTIPLLSNIGHLHEMYELLQSHFVDFDADNKQQVMQAILALPKPAKDHNDIIIQRTQRNWLSAIKGKGFVEADQLFDRLDSNPELGTVSSHPSFISWMEMRAGPGPSPYAVPDLLAYLDQNTLIEKLNGFNEQEGHWFDEPTVSALVDALVEAVVKEPLKFMLALDDFKEAKRPYQYGIINGFKKLWEKEKSPEVGSDWENIWAHLLSLFEALLGNAEFWSEPVPERRDLTPTKAWIPSLIADFLRSAVKKDEKSIAYQFLPRVQNLIIILLEKSSAEWESKDSDPMTQAINTERGRAIEALLDYALFTARGSDREHKEHKHVWKEVEPVFDYQLAQCKGRNQAFSTLMGAYAANLEYLDHDWLARNIKLIFPIEYMDNFTSAISGLAYTPVSKSLYLQIRDAGIVQKAVNHDRLGEHVRESLLQRMAIAYLEGDEELDSSRFQPIFLPANIDDLYAIVNFLWRMHKQEFEEKYLKRILAFWSKSYTSAMQVDPKPKSLLSIMGLLMCHLSSITEEQREWLINLAPFAAYGHHADFFLEELDRLADASPAAIKDIFAALLTTYTPYQDADGVLESLIRKLLDAGFKAEMLPIVAKLHRIGEFKILYKEMTTFSAVGDHS